jgi:hypothetical protein
MLFPGRPLLPVYWKDCIRYWEKACSRATWLGRMGSAALEPQTDLCPAFHAGARHSLEQKCVCLHLLHKANSLGVASTRRHGRCPHLLYSGPPVQATLASTSMAPTPRASSESCRLIYWSKSSVYSFCRSNISALVMTNWYLLRQGRAYMNSQRTAAYAKASWQ